MPAPPSGAAPSTVAPMDAAPLRFKSVTSNRQALQLRRLWGIDNVHVRSTASGALVRFSYRVVEVDKAKILNSKEATPYLVDEQHGLALQIPVMEQVRNYAKWRHLKMAAITGWRSRTKGDI